MACFFNENRVVIYDLETREQKVINVPLPKRCTSSQRILAITSIGYGLRLFSTNGVLDHIVPDSTKSRCAAFHPRNTNILAIGFQDGAVRIWDVSSQADVSFFKQHRGSITSTRFAPDCRLFLSSYDNDASILTLDDQFQNVSSVKLKGHIGAVFDILPFFFSNQCVTCSYDQTIKVWDCETGTCLHTMTEHEAVVTSLALHPSGHYFASGSYDQSVIIWSCETVDIKNRISYPSAVQSLVFSDSNTLYAGIYGHGVMSCNALTGEVGPVIIPGTGIVSSLTHGMTSLMFSTKHTPLTLLTPLYLHPSPGLHPHMHCGPCLHNTLCTWLWWCCGRRS